MQKALKQLPRPVMSARTDSSITISVDRKNDMDGVARGGIMFELQFKKQGEGQWTTLQSDASKCVASY